MSSDAPELSIIIPAYNEEGRLGRTLARIHEYFATGPFPLAALEIIVVDDGSTDRTGHIAQQWADGNRQVKFHLLSNGKNRGKGYSVRRGMLEACGRIALFTDADLSAPIEESEKLLAALDGSEVAIGSRSIDRSLISVRQSVFRECAGIIFNLCVRLFTRLPLHDTQCGFKAFLLGPCRVIFEQQRTERFGFDPEILFLAQRYGLRTVEVPVRWAHDPATKIHVLWDSLLMFAALIHIRWSWLRGLYPIKRASQRSLAF